MDLVKEQIELEKKMTQSSSATYRRELERAKQESLLGCTSVSVKLITLILKDYTDAVKAYLNDYLKGKAIRSTLAAEAINRLDDAETTAYIASRTILNSLYSKTSTQTLYRSIGQALEDEYKMRACKKENHYYYDNIQQDLKKRGAKNVRRKYVTGGVFKKRLNFFTEAWTVTEKLQTGMVLTQLFIDVTGLLEYTEFHKKKKIYKTLIPVPELTEWMEDTNEKLEVLNPFFLPMICKPKPWTDIFEGGYISPYLKRNRLIKNDSKEYLTYLKKVDMPCVYTAINHLQNTQWQINKKILETVNLLWEQGGGAAGLPDRYDESLIPFPYPNGNKDTWTEEEKEEIKKWKSDTYEIHKRNVSKRSIRLLNAQIIRIAQQFEKYDTIWFPYQMDFRGRMYPIPVLLQPQGTDLAKGLLQFARGKTLDKNSVRWLEIHGANVYGYDKESYEKRIEWVKNSIEDIKQYAKDPLQYRGWTKADKPFQFLAFCFEYSAYLDNPNTFRTHLPIQLDGTCNGLQHYAALLKDKTGGSAVNLVDSDKPNDIYTKVAKKLEEKLNELREHINSGYDNTDSNDDGYSVFMAEKWLALGINRKLTKRPVMVLPYGGTVISCRDYIEEYLEETYSGDFLWKHFETGDNTTDCKFKASLWLASYLWSAIKETIKSAVEGMSFLRKTAALSISKGKHCIDWWTPAGLLVSQLYHDKKKKIVSTELYGTVLISAINIDTEDADRQRHINGICPNFIHSLDASALMLYLLKCKDAGITDCMAVHDCYGTLAPDTDKSARFLREAFVEIYKQPLLEYFRHDVLYGLDIDDKDMPELPQQGDLDIEEVLESSYFFN